MCALWRDFNHGPRSQAEVTCVHCTSSVIYPFFLILFIAVLRLFHGSLCCRNIPASKASNPLATCIDFLLSGATLHTKTTNLVLYSQGRSVFTSKPAVYLVLQPRPRTNRQASEGSISSNVLTTFMNFSLAAQGDRLPSG